MARLVKQVALALPSFDLEFFFATGLLVILAAGLVALLTLPGI